MGSKFYVMYKFFVFLATYDNTEVSLELYVEYNLYDQYTPRLNLPNSFFVYNLPPSIS
jgi:hypothetical protein